MGDERALSQDIAFLQRFGVPLETLQAAQERAERYGVPAAEALLTSGAVSEFHYYRCMAMELGLPFENAPASDGDVLTSLPPPAAMDSRARMLILGGDGGETRSIAPNGAYFAQLKQWIADNPDIAERMRVSTLTANRTLLEHRLSRPLSDTATNGLLTRFPILSAKQVISVRQAIIGFILLQVLALIAVASTGLAANILHVGAAILYLACIALRLLAIRHVETKPWQPQDYDRSADHELPLYSVLVPLYREAGQVEGLVEALGALDWPAERLEIKLICERDDTATLEACRHAVEAPGRHHFAVVSVASGGPRTKPKALNYAMPLCRGEFIVVYDAEDRPHPTQLREAYERFSNAPDTLACLQAPLAIHNHHEGRLPTLFALEYAALFDGLLPYLAKLGAPLPLGGTSNHLRRSVLDDAAGWDPYNVTEDADLGVRLARAGYKTGVLSAPTWEEAPIALDAWVPQRTRWFKGWYQTWLVHMRNPVATARDLGFRDFLIFQIMVAGMAISALVHPLLAYLVARRVVTTALNPSLDPFSDPLIWMDAACIILGYLALGWLAWRSVARRGLTHLRRGLIWIPVYWFLLSAAAWRALWHLIRRPHNWEKTPHRLTRHSAPAVESPVETALS